MDSFKHALLMALVIALPVLGDAQDSAVATTDTAPSERDVEFSSGGVSLSGTVVAPENAEAALVLVLGSGQQGRDLKFARALARKRIATLTYDKRGVGKSGGTGGTYAGPEVGTNNVDPKNLDLLSGDASAAVKELERQIASPQTPVGLLGISQAGWLIPLVAAHDPDVKFMILWSGPLVSTLEQLRFQSLTGGEVDFWDHHSEAEVREHLKSDPDRYPFPSTDPVDSLRKLAIPGLWLYGDRDVRVPVRVSIERLDALIADGKPFEHHVFENSGHALPPVDSFLASIHWINSAVIRH